MGTVTLQVTEWPTVPISALTEHPGNVRLDMAIDREFVASIKAEGVRIPLIITTADEPGVFRVIDGHRRLLGAIEAGADEVPYVLDQHRAGDEAGQFLDMVITSRHARKLTATEEAAALFAAAECGASKTRLVKAYGKRDEVAAALKVATLADTTRAAVDATNYPWTMTELAVLEEFAGDEEATARLFAAAEDHSFGYQVERERIEREEQRKRAEVRAEAEAAGVRVVDEPLAAAVRLSWLETAEGERITAEEHAACPGHLAVMDRWSPSLGYLCEAPAEHGHTNTRTMGAASTPAKGEAEGTDASAQRRRVVNGNKDWRAARTNRQNFLTALLARKALPRDQADAVARFTAKAYLTMPRPLTKNPNGAGDTQLTLLGMSQRPESWATETDRASARRLSLLTLAPIAAAYEKSMTDAMWRVDTHPWMQVDRPHASEWLRFCESVGHVLSPVERAVAEGRAYAPEDPAPTLTDQVNADAGEPAEHAEDDPAEDESADPAADAA